MVYTEYKHEKNYNTIIFNTKITNVDHFKILENKIEELLRTFIINKNTDMYIEIIIKPILFEKYEFVLVENDLYKIIFKAGKCQHYIQKKFMKNFINADYINDNERYIYKKEGRKLINFNKKNRFNNIGSDEYFFSRNDNYYLDNFISSLEKKSNQLIDSINKNITGNDYFDYNNYIKEIFIYMIYPLFIKSSYDIKTLHYNIRDTYSNMYPLYLSENEEKELNRYILDPKSDYYYYMLENYMIENMNIIMNEFHYQYIYIIDGKDIPLSENLLFYIDDDLLKIGFNEKICLFIFNENTIILLSKYEYDTNNLNMLKEFINKNIRNFIINNAHDFLITKEILDITKLNERSNYSKIDFKNEINLLLNFIKYDKESESGKIIFSKESVIPLIFKELTKEQKIIYLFKEKNILKNHLLIIDKNEFYISKYDKDIIEKYEDLRYDNRIYNYRLSKFVEEKNNVYIHTKIVREEIKKIVLYRKNKNDEISLLVNVKIPICLDIGIIKIIYYIDLHLYNDFITYFSKYIIKYEEYEKYEELEKTNIYNLFFIKYKDGTTTLNININKDFQ